MIGEEKKQIVFIGSDHAGFQSKNKLVEYLEGEGYDATDLGCFSEDPCDYPDIAREVSEKIVEHKDAFGILICGTGIGMSMAANRFKGVRAALCYDELNAQISRHHNDANVLCVSGDLTGDISLRKIVEIWLTTEFNGGRHKRRVDKIAAIEEGKDPADVEK